MLNIIGVAVLLTITSLTGIVIFAYYVQQDCDPFTSGKVGNSNQVSPTDLEKMDKPARVPYRYEL